VCSLLVAASVHVACAAAAADVTVGSDPVFTARLTDGTTASGRVRRIGTEGEIVLVPAKGPETSLPLNRLVKLSRDSLSPPLTPEAPAVLFPEGDRLYRAAVGAAGETAIDVQSYTLGNLSVPIDSILGLVLGLQPDADALERLIGNLRDEPRTKEVAWLSNGDRLTGGFLGLTDKALEFQSGKDPLRLDRSGVVALAFDPKLVSYPRPDSGFLDLTLSDGSRVGVVDAKVDQGQVVGKARFGRTVKVPLSDVVRFHARTSSVVYLAEREPAGVQYVPYVGPPRPYRRDATVEGHPFRLSGEEFDRGIGTQSRTLLAYRLQPGDRRFQATVGLDDRAGPMGNVVFRVRVDDEFRFVSPPMSARDSPKTIDVDLAGAKLLVLFTDFGERGGVRDIADWVEARIIRDEPGAAPRPK
jgi:hypothetical protein